MKINNRLIIATELQRPLLFQAEQFPPALSVLICGITKARKVGEGVRQQAEVALFRLASLGCQGFRQLLQLRGGLCSPSRARRSNAPPLPPFNMASAGAGMNERERDGCRELLDLLQTDDLLALADTVTSRLVQPSNRQEAINVILLYSQSAEELLKRKKVFREIIFKYLATKGVIVPPSSEKHQLIYRAKEYWCEGLKVCTSEQTYTNPSIQQPEVGGTQGDQDDNKECHNLAEEFCQWYFRILNSQNPLIGEPQEEWGPQHFWGDVTLKFCYNTSEQNMEEYSGAELQLCGISWTESMTQNHLLLDEDG
ncbi:putative protein C3orf38 like [Crotalus adamanteus]|uniref:Uncharacterized protein n=1 Tax=Crotalus adamanteus TaxID=8729 RepID=A0AAW1BK52_CROAD